LLLPLLLKPCDAINLIYCTTEREIADAVLFANAGDEIVIASGEYFNPRSVASFSIEAHLGSSGEGTETDRIILRGEDPLNPPVISGLSYASWSVIRLVNGAKYWTIQDLILTNADKGVVLDDSHHVELKRLQIRDIGEEAIHVRDGSTYTLIESCTIANTGLYVAGFGEGIYVGSDRSVHTTYDPSVTHTTVRYCTIGPNVRAEAFDIKEGTSETIIEHNVVNAAGLSGENNADSFVDIKGTRTYVRKNRFDRASSTALTKGVAIIDRQVDLSAYQNVIHDNTFIFGKNADNMPMVQAGANTESTVVFNNTRIPSSGTDYTGPNLVRSCCPSWYKRPDSLPTVCFSSENRVLVEGRGYIRMDRLKIGDMVQVGNNEFSRLYSFGHLERNIQTEYLQIYATGLEDPLEISPDHMVFVDKVGAVPASAVQVGLNLVAATSGGFATVTKIDVVRRTGAFAPFTESGTVIVSDVLASSYVSMSGSEAFEVGGLKFVSMHWLAHAFQAPHRMVCKWNMSFCDNEGYSDEGVSYWVYRPHLAAKWLLEQHGVLCFIMSFPVTLLGASFFLIEIVSSSAGLLLLTVSSAIVLPYRAKKKEI
jgi:hypothetical protein